MLLLLLDELELEEDLDELPELLEDDREDLDELLSDELKPQSGVGISACASFKSHQFRV